MADLIRNWKIWLLFLVIIASMGVFLFAGLNFGIDFQGGTLFQVQLSEKVSSDEMERIVTVMEKRINSSGLKDISVFSLGNEFVIIELPETDPEAVARIESIIKRQGRFEVTITDSDSNGSSVMFTGADVIQVDQGASHVSAVQQHSEFLFGWNLPFTLKTVAAKNFRDLSFHRCSLVTFSQQGSTYDCSYTYFFIDRPTTSVLIFSDQDFSQDTQLFLQGNFTEGIPQDTSIDEVLQNIDVPFFTVSSFDEKEILALQNLISSGQYSNAVFSENLSEQAKEQLKNLGFKLIQIESTDGIPWLWNASGLNSIVRLQPSITGNEPFVDSPDEAQIITDLIITGSSSSQEEAFAERDETKILLQSGSLPVSVQSISKETISPLLGENFLIQAGWIGIIVLLAVSAVIFLRYRNPRISIAIVFTALVEAFTTLSFTSLTGNIDLAVIAGIIAAVGTGVDDQIVITDELLKGAERVEASLLTRIKNAFFIVIAAAVTLLAVMFPIILFGTGMIKLVGFAIATIVGVSVGVLITRPAYGEIARFVLEK